MIADQKRQKSKRMQAKPIRNFPCAPGGLMLLSISFDLLPNVIFIILGDNQKVFQQPVSSTISCNHKSMSGVNYRHHWILKDAPHKRIPLFFAKLKTDHLN